MRKLKPCWIRGVAYASHAAEATALGLGRQRIHQLARQAGDGRRRRPASKPVTIDGTTYPCVADAAVVAVDFTALGHDGEGYCLGGEPFTGLCKTRWRGVLRAVSGLEGGLECGVSVAWHDSGRIELYSEMQGDVYHGRHAEWDEDGTPRVDERYVHGVRAWAR